MVSSAPTLRRGDVLGASPLASPIAAPLVARPRLWRLLDGAGSLTILRAPAGFGKTALMRQWLESSDRARMHPTAAVKVRPHGGGGHDFWISLIDALSDIGLPAPALMEHRSPRSIAERMLSRVDRPLRLWIDNFEHVDVAQADEVLADLASGSSLMVVIGVQTLESFARAARTHPGALTVTADDLRFDADETRRLAAAGGTDLAEASIAAVRRETGGWPEPTHLVLDDLSKHPQDDRDDGAIARRAAVAVSSFLESRVVADILPDGAASLLASAVPASSERRGRTPAGREWARGDRKARRIGSADRATGRRRRRASLAREPPRHPGRRVRAAPSGSTAHLA